MAGLEPVPEDWRRALAVVAHPDDLEYGTASAIARWTAQGKEVTYVMVTDGEAGIDGMAPDEAGPLRRDEEIDAPRPRSACGPWSSSAIPTGWSRPTCPSGPTSPR